MSEILRAFLVHERALKRFLGRFFTTAQDVDDLAQETFLRAFAADAAEPIIASKAFLFRVARNLALNEKARMWNSTTVRLEDSGAPDVIDDDVGAEERLDSRRKLALFAEAVSALPPQRRRVFLLRKIHGRSYRDIAIQLGISESTVEKHVAAGLVSCSKYLSRYGYQVGASPKSSTIRAGAKEKKNDVRA